MPRRSFRIDGDRPFLDIVSYGRGIPTQRQVLLPVHVEQIARTVRHTPEVMVKISGGGQSAKAVAAHFKYLSRQEFEIETDDGERLNGKELEKGLIQDWELNLDAAESRSPYRGMPGRKPAKLVHNIVLSMPAGTPTAGVLEASRAFAREQFALKHRYALVLHTDQPHPHVHLVVKAMSEQGKRMNIRKGTLREWRRQFASHLRAQGIAANATDRAVRGVTNPQKRDGIYRAMRAGGAQIEPGKVQILDTRRRVVRGWLGVRETLRAGGREGLANEVERFISGMPPPVTEREWLTQALLEHGLDRHLETQLNRTR